MKRLLSRYTSTRGYCSKAAEDAFVRTGSDGGYPFPVWTDMVKTKIVATLGPASQSPPVLSELIAEGVDVFRLNFSHGTHEQHTQTFQLIRELAKKHKKHIGILCDIQGPKIRTGTIDKPFNVSVGQKIRVTPHTIVGNEQRITITYPAILEDLKEGDLIYINDGIVQLSVKSKTADDLICEVNAPGTISSNKGCNMPTANVSIKVPTDKDKEDLQLIAKLDPEFVAASFIGQASDVQNVRKFLHECGNKQVKIISKIERGIALKNIDEIIATSDAVMVARGDLGVETPPHEVPISQKLIVKKCNREGKPAIIATQMLESMIYAARPTRAECNDVFNAVLDGADAVMLSGETSVGKYPVDSVRQMNSLCKAAEEYLPERDWKEFSSMKKTLVESVAKSCQAVAREYKDLGYKGKIIVMTESGFTAAMVSKYRPPLPIVVITPSERVARELNMTWGVTQSIAMKDIEGQDAEARDISAIKAAFKAHFVEKEDHVILVNTKPSSTGNVHMAIYDVKALSAAHRI